MRRTVFRLLNPAEGEDRASRVVDMVLVTLIACSVLAVILESIPAVERAWGAVLYWFDVFTISVFWVEYLLRIWSSVEVFDRGEQQPFASRLLFMVSCHAIIDLLAILPFFLAAFVAIDLRFLRVLRILRIFKLSHYFSALEVLLEVVRVERHAFGAAFFLLSVGVLFAASGIYLFEHEIQPEAFGSIPAALLFGLGFAGVATAARRRRS